MEQSARTARRGAKPGRSRSDEVYEEIYRDIVAGRWALGDRLPTETELSDLFGASRTVIREALMRLKIDGVVTTRQGAGSYVTGTPARAVLEFTEPGSVADIHRCYEFRVGVEGEAAWLAARNQTPERLEEIRETLDAVRRAFERGEVGAEEDVQFHIAVGRATENHFYATTIESVARAVLFGMNIALALSQRPPEERLERVLREHTEIYDAIRQGRADDARGLMRSHIERARQRVFLGGP